MSGHGNGIFGGSGSMFGAEGSAEVNVDLNLTPLMDVMSNILFFLLASFGAAIISFLGVSVPVQSDGEPAPPKSDTITLNLQITPDAYKLNAAQNDAADPAKLAAVKQTIPKKDGAYDLAALTEAVRKVKLEFGGSDTIMIVPDETTTYEQIIQAMDATRELKQGEGPRLRLFPKVVVADLVKADKE